VGGKADRSRIAHHFLGKKPAAEVLVLDEKFFVADIDALEEPGIVTIAAKP
jgi:hypothetical protein